MTVYSVKDAWTEADKLFPTDYLKDDVKSSRAGYDVYTSTVDENNSYICDLGNRLEVNLEDGTTTNIWIEDAPYTEKQIDEMLKFIDKTLYEMEDNFFTKMNSKTGLKEAHNALYDVFRKAKNICDECYPNSYLYEKYNLNEA